MNHKRIVQNKSSQKLILNHQYFGEDMAGWIGMVNTENAAEWKRMQDWAWESQQEAAFFKSDRAEDREAIDQV
ncbi:hypothetical protein Ddc_06844 [Ditylenchus destructor]|nr:hypothetical protein Ddc_06844 [Ditylenchus destructor]